MTELKATYQNISYRVYDLGRPMAPGMAQSPNHPVYTHTLVRRHGDMVRADGSSAANDLIVLGTHVGTHIDALSHVSYWGKLHGGIPVEAAIRQGRFSQLGAETIQPIIGRGVLLDVPTALGWDHCPDAYEITPDDLERTVAAQGTRPGKGDVVLIRSGWGRHWSDPVRYVGHQSGVPGVSAAGAQWIAECGVRAAGADTIAFEWLAPGAGHALLPAHRVLLVEHGIYLIETMALEELAADRRYEFQFIAVPLPLVGATGSPVRPLALVPESADA